MKLPETYWDDVNRYYGEILTGLPVTTQAGARLPVYRAEYSWPAQEADTRALVLREQCRVLGVTAVSHHHLGLRRTVSDTSVVHWIRFHPDRNKIVRVQDDSYSKNEFPDISDHVKIVWERYKIARRMGILIPTEEDYALLHDELQRGAQYRSYDVNEGT